MSDVMEKPSAFTTHPSSFEEIRRAAEAACARVAPCWPLKNFVAVNPFLGVIDDSFHAACAHLYRVSRIRALMPRAFYRAAIERGEIDDAALAEALAGAPRDWLLPHTVAALRAAASRDPLPTPAYPAFVPTVAEVLDELAHGDRQRSRTAFMVDEISRFMAAYFDEGQSVWRLPCRNLPIYPAWRAAIRHDLNAETMGITGFRGIVAAVPDDPAEAIAYVVEHQGVPARAVEDYLHQALLDIGGWASYIAYRNWHKALDGIKNDRLLHLLAIRLVFGYALFLQRTDSAFRRAWRDAMDRAAMPPADEQLGEDPELAVDMVLHEAYEVARRRDLLEKLSSPKPRPSPARPRLQMAFCIDVRSEPYRRALESVSADIETIGFAGFYGFPIEYMQIAHVKGRKHCPVLLKPVFTVCEAVDGATPAESERLLSLRLLRRRARKAWKSFKLSAVSSFMYVETMGLFYIGKIVGDMLGVTRTVHDPNTDGLDNSVISRLHPSIAPGTLGGRPVGFTDEQRLAMAEAVLRAMSFTGPFAPLVLLAGHGSTTVNNPHAAGLDCGACGGYTGEANARVAAAILNDAVVRRGLIDKGIRIPDDTWFLGVLHNTTTDDVKFFDLDRAPSTHAADIAAAQAALQQASRLNRLQRAPGLGIAPGPEAERKVLRRSRNWAEVRPEWGLAGNYAFIAAPREVTRGVDLGGRVFLHNYDWQRDQDFATLKLIMTAPMVVANWINLQYYGSVVNNAAFGCGNKVLHNITGTIAVLEGNGGDLRPGLPIQSLHDGKRYVHEPLRLSVFLAAPLEAINQVIAGNETVRNLVDNRWLHLFALDDRGCVSARYQGNLTWQTMTG